MIDDQAFEQLVAEALDELPEEFQRQLDNVEVLVEPWPTAEHCRAAGLKPWQRRSLYGLYQGIPLTERDTSYMLVPPDTITLFSEPLKRDFRSPQLLRTQIRRTVLHELAHYFGIDDDRLHELGAY